MTDKQTAQHLDAEMDEVQIALQVIEDEPQWRIQLALVRDYELLEKKLSRLVNRQITLRQLHNQEAK